MTRMSPLRRATKEEREGGELELERIGARDEKKSEWVRRGTYFLAPE